MGGYSDRCLLEFDVDLETQQCKVLHSRLEGLDGIESLRELTRAVVDAGAIYYIDLEMTSKVFNLDAILEHLRKEQEVARAFRVNTKSGVQWATAFATPTRRKGDEVQALHVRVINQEIFDIDGASMGVDELREILFDGMGSFYSNLIFIDVENDAYKVLNLYGNEPSQEYKTLPVGTYTKDNIAYADNLVYEEDREPFLRFTSLDWYREALTEKGARRNFQLRHIYNGEYRWVTINTVCTRRDEGAFHVLFWVYDIQDTLTGESNPDDIMTQELIGQFRWERQGENAPRLIMGNSYRRITGLGFCTSPEDACTEYMRRLPQEDFETYRNYFLDLKRTPGKQGPEFTYRWNHPTLGIRYFRGRATCVSATEGYVCYRGYHQDITETALAKRRQDKRLEKALFAAEAASRAKSIFLSNMSHDIRTPMNAIVGFAELLEKRDTSEEKRQEYIRKIKDSSTFLLQLVTNVLEMSRIENKQLDISVQPTNLTHIGEKISAVLSDQFYKKKLHFTWQLDIEHENVMCDATRICEINLNMLSNAVRHTPEGGNVTLRVTESPCEKPRWATYTIVIEDTGEGISEEFLPHVFDSFAKENETEYGSVTGAGIGMAITKQLIELMGGTIDVESTRGVGTKFTVVLPLELAGEDAVEAEEKAATKQVVAEGKRILVAEDNDLNAEIVTSVLEDEGFATERACDGAECLLKVAQAQDGYYDAVLMDMQMPNMNGCEAARAIRMLEGAKAHLPIIALTANAFSSDKEQALEAGMSGFLAKPLNVDELLTLLGEQLGV